MCTDRRVMDGRTIRVEWATKNEFRKFGWIWVEHPSPSPSRFVGHGSQAYRHECNLKH